MSRDIPDWASQLANTLLLAVQKKDPHTFLHCCRVGREARRLAKAMGLTSHEQNVLEYSGLFHDIGKIGIPDSILLKPGRLEEDEIQKMKDHPLHSVEMLEPLSHIPFFRFTLPGIRYHHEKVDGSGYPFGMQGERIPLAARIIAIVDTVDAMTNVRPYRKPLPLEKAHKELVDFSGSQFDGNIVKVYLDAYDYERDRQETAENEVIVSTILKKAA